VEITAATVVIATLPPGWRSARDRCTRPAVSERRSIFAPGLFDGQVALITGGGSGIGLAVARELAYLGASVAIAGRKAEKIDAAVATITADGVAPDRVLGAACDIREPEQITAFVGRVMERFGRLDVLVNNAGGQFPTPAEAMSPRGWEAVIRNNLNGTFFMTREVASRAMIPSKRGRIVNITAMVARGFPGMSHTGAARAGVENLTKSLAVEWAQHGIRVNAVAPGTIRSSGTVQYGDELLEIARRATPVKRLGTQEEVARLIVFLASDQSDFITGAVYTIDGGASLWGDIWSIPEPAAAT
jgi:NAD(P)-dependent dehydrogenase (short-subunit alcohol dehydrogenase family)